VKNTRPAWRSLRPLLLAAAAATSWLALSASAATADATPESAPLVKSAGSSLVAITTSAADHTGSVVLELKTEQPPTRSELSAVIAFPAALPELRQAVSDVPASADGLLHSVPAVTSRPPANPIDALTDPVVALADTVAGAASSTVLPVTVAVTEILDPIVKPIIDHGVRPVPSPIPCESTALPEVLAGGSTSPGDSRSVVPSGTREETAPPSASILADATSESTGTWVSSSRAVGAAVTSGSRGPFQSLAALAGSAAPESPAEGGPDALLYAVPAVPGSGAAGSANSGGSPSVPAWLSNHHFMIPSAPASPIRGAGLRAPSPVSFEPGSSPD
jgi:hypothetical protein